MFLLTWVLRIRLLQVDRLLINAASSIREEFKARDELRPEIYIIMYLYCVLKSARYNLD